MGNRSYNSVRYDFSLQHLISTVALKAISSIGNLSKFNISKNIAYINYIWTYR